MQVVVGAALVEDGRVLVAHRPGQGWELPGGKVEPGESPEAALVREISEELGCTVEVTGWLAGQSEIRPGLVLRVAAARLVAGEPVPFEHDAIRWVAADLVDDLDWLPADRPFLDQVRALLAGT
ncbi:MAG: hydrolase [Nocardioidaceae bacterium]|nr:hydrolase [Nocardioidaceae bacterium]